MEQRKALYETRFRALSEQSGDSRKAAAELENDIQALQAGEGRRGSRASQSNGCCFDPARWEQVFACGANWERDWDEEKAPNEWYESAAVYPVVDSDRCQDANGGSGGDGNPSTPRHGTFTAWETWRDGGGWASVTKEGEQGNIGKKGTEKNSQGKDPKTFQENSQGRDTSTLERNSQGEKHKYLQRPCGKVARSRKAEGREVEEEEEKEKEEGEAQKKIEVADEFETNHDECRQNRAADWRFQANHCACSGDYVNLMTGNGGGRGGWQ